MATLLGSTAHSADHAYWYGGNIYNMFAARLTLPAGGPWMVTKLGVWAAGKDSSPSAKLVLWANGSSVLAQSASFTLASSSFGLGNSDKYEKDLTAPEEVAGGTTVMVGIAFNDSANTPDTGDCSARSRRKTPMRAPFSAPLSRVFV